MFLTDDLAILSDICGIIYNLQLDSLVVKSSIDSPTYMTSFSSSAVLWVGHAPLSALLVSNDLTWLKLVDVWSTEDKRHIQVAYKS